MTTSSKCCASRRTGSPASSDVASACPADTAGGTGGGLDGGIVQTEASAGIPAQLAGLPALTLDEGQLGDLELLLTGAFAPLRGYLTPAEVTSVSAHGTLPDGTPWPVPVTLDVPAGSIKPDA